MNSGSLSTSRDGALAPRLAWLLVFLLLGHAVWITADGRDHAGSEFYCAWLPAQLLATAAAPLPSPYADPAAYADTMNARADSLWRELGASEPALAGLFRAPPQGAAERDPAAGLLRRLAPRLDARQHEVARAAQGWLRANAQSRRLEPTASPLWCAAFALLPSDYDRATALYATLQLAALLLATTVLTCAAGGACRDGVLVAVALMVAYPSYARDVSAGAGGCVALLLTALPVALARRSAFAAWSLLLVFLLLEPRAATIPLAIAACLLARADGRRAAVPACALGLALLLWPCLAFGSMSVWFDWLAAGVRRTSVWAVVAPLVVLGSCAFAARATRGAWRYALVDPAAAAAVGAVAAACSGPAAPRSAMLAIAALLWLAQSRAAAVPLVLTAIAAALYAELAGTALPLLDTGPAATPPFLATLGASAWVPLWLATLWQLARSERASAPDS